MTELAKTDENVKGEEIDRVAEAKKLLEETSLKLVEYEILIVQEVTNIYKEVNDLLTVAKKTPDEDWDLESISFNTEDSDVVLMESFTGFTQDLLKTFRSLAYRAKSVAEEIKYRREFFEAHLDSSMPIKTAQVSYIDISELSDKYMSLTIEYGEFRDDYKEKFERFVTRQLKSVGMPHNKQTVDKALESDFTSTLIANRRATENKGLILHFAHIRDCYSAISVLDKALYNVYDEFGRTAEYLMRYDIIIEGVEDKFEDVIQFSIEMRKYFQNLQKDDLKRSTSDIEDIVSLVNITPQLRASRYLKYLLLFLIGGVILSAIAFFVILFLPTPLDKQ